MEDLTQEMEMEALKEIEEEMEEEMEEQYFQHQLEVLEEAEEEMERAEAERQAELAMSMKEEIETLQEYEEEMEAALWQAQMDALLQVEEEKEAMEREMEREEAAEEILHNYVSFFCNERGRVRAWYGRFDTVRDHEVTIRYWWKQYMKIRRRLERELGEEAVEDWDSPGEFHNANAPGEEPGWPTA